MAAFWRLKRAARVRFVPGGIGQGEGELRMEEREKEKGWVAVVVVVDESGGSER